MTVMPDRRQFVRLSALTAAAAGLAACGTPDRPVSATGAAALMPCPDLVPGSVTGQSGTVNGWTAAFVDVYSDRQGADFNWQYPVVLSDKAGVGLRYQQNKIVKGEHWLILALVAGKANSMDPIPLSDTPLDTRPILTNFEYPAGSGVLYKWQPTFVAKSSKNCNASEETATGGTVTLTAMDAARVEGSYDLDFGADHVQGSFVAPRAAVAGSMDYSGCPTRPSSPSCITG